MPAYQPPPGANSRRYPLMMRQDVTDEILGTICTWHVNDVICGAAPDAWFVHGCAHEHVSRPVALCAVHDAMAQEGSFTCGRCLHGPQPHECPVTTTRVPRPVPVPGGAP